MLTGCMGARSFADTPGICVQTTASAPAPADSEEAWQAGSQHSPYAPAAAVEHKTT